jgi:multidrug efflux system membrane fusion protein
MASVTAAADRFSRLRFLVLGLVALVLLCIGLVVLSRPAPAKPQKSGLVSVSAATAAVRDVPLVLTELGAAAPWRGVTIRAQVSGRLVSVDFAEGAFVRKGQRLAAIDEAPFRAALMQAEGALKRDQAILEEARLDLKRYQTLAEQNSIARQQVDAAAALVKQDEGTVLLDQGAVAAARVNVEWCTIRAPMDGRMGVRLVDPGNVVAPADASGLAILNEISPMAVVFSVPEADFQRISEVSRRFSEPLKVSALSQETGALLGQGELRIADNHVDPSSGTVELKARFENLDQRLWPSQFVTARLTLQTLPRAVVIPVGAVNPGPRGSFAYVIGPDQAVKPRPVEVAAVQDGAAILRSGLKGGERVVTDGQMLLKPGAKVVVIPPQAKAARS